LRPSFITLKGDKIMFNEEFENALIDSIKEAVDNSAVDILSDMVSDNPDWWSAKIREVFEETITKALKDDRFVKQTVSDFLSDYLNEIDLQVMASEILEDRIKDAIIDKLVVEVKK